MITERQESEADTLVRSVDFAQSWDQNGQRAKNKSPYQVYADEWVNY